jgi:type I restriction enzyme S subunit
MKQLSRLPNAVAPGPVGGWRATTLGEVAEFLDSRRVPVNNTERLKRIAGKRTDELYPYYGANGLVGWIDDYLFDEPLILLAEDGGNFGSTSRPIAYAVSGKYWVNNHAHVLRPRPGVDFNFLLHAIRLRPDVGALVSGSTRGKLNQDTAARIPIRLPLLPEQKLIAARLQEQFAIIERAAAAAEEQRRAAKALAPAYVMRELTGGKSAQWPRKTLGALSLGNGQYGTSQKSHLTETPGTVPVLGIGNIKGGEVVWHRLKFTALSPEDGVKYRLQAGDLIFCRTNSAELVGETAVFDGSRDAAFASYLVRFRLNPELADPRFISAYINSPWGRHFIQQNLSRAIGQANVSASVVANMEIPAPPVAVQRSIMDRLAHATVGAGRLAQQVSEELQSISRMPTALLRAAFQGDT